jgi:hypothetical protein
MKLAAGNPNLMKKQATRVNRRATLGALPSTLGDKNPSKYARGGAVLMERTDDMASPRTFNHMRDGQVYIPERMESVRPGATDALRLPSRGYPT